MSQPDVADSSQRVVARTLEEILANPAVLQPPAVVVPRLAWAGRVSLLAGREKLGKSTLLGAAAAAVSQGRRWLGDPTTRGLVLMVGLEEHISDLVKRLVRWSADPKRVRVVDSLATARDPIAEVAALTAELRPELVFVDTLAALVERLGLDSGAASQWTPVMADIARISRETDAAIVLSHHATKSSGGYRDSTAIGAGVDVILEMFASRDADSRRLAVRARWPLGDYTVRLAGDKYELADGELSLDARVYLYAEAHPDCSLNALRTGVTGRSGEISAAVGRLLASGDMIENPGTHSARCFRVAPSPGTGLGTATDAPTCSHGNPYVVGGGTGRGNRTRVRACSRSTARRVAVGNETRGGGAVTAAAELIDRAAAAGIELIDAGAKLRVRGPDPLPAELLEALRERKREVLELLRRCEPATADDATRALESEAKASIGASSRLDAETVARMTLQDFAASLLVLEVRSEVLRETVILAGDGATVDPERARGRAVYRGAELLRLVAAKLDHAALRQIHAAKRMFGGSILPS